MGIISRQYIKQLVGRYDREVGVPYFSSEDFDGLIEEAFAFINSKGVEIHYFFYYYPNHRTDKIVLFCPGIGPGHIAYFKEIEYLARHGYKVLTLDYTGCGESKGKYLASLNMPTLDVTELLDHLALKEEVVLFGHSLGAFTALNTINLRDDVNKAIIMSGFVCVPSLINASITSKFVSSRILRYEKKLLPTYYSLDNIEYLKKTKDHIYIIHSIDDKMVPCIFPFLEKAGVDNKHLKTLKTDHKNHNPDYQIESVNYFNEVFDKYMELIKKKVIKTDEDKINYFKDVSLEKMTKQDEDVLGSIIDFIN